MIVLKFGGTSVRDSAAFERVLDIVTSNPAQGAIAGETVTKLVVLSASSGVTDKLLALVESAASKNTEKVNRIYTEIESLQNNIIEGLFAKDNPFTLAVRSKVKALLDELRKFIEGIAFFGEATPRAMDNVVSFGELLSTSIFHYFAISRGSDNAFIDSRELIKTDSNFSMAAVDFRTSSEKINSVYSENKILGKTLAVAQGFIGSDFGRHTTTLGRGGSDYSAAIYGKLFSAEEIQIWTDVDGILTADPRIADKTKSIAQMGFDEVRALAFFGAKVLHPQTLLPAIESKIPVVVLNSINKSHPGTRILSKIEKDETEMHSVVRINATRISFSLGHFDDFANKANQILNQFNRNNVKLFSVSILPDSLIIWFENFPDYTELFREIFEIDYLVDNSKCLIAIVGTNLHRLKPENIVSDTLSPEFVSINSSSVTILISVGLQESTNAVIELNTAIIGAIN